MRFQHILCLRKPAKQIAGKANVPNPPGTNLGSTNPIGGFETSQVGLQLVMDLISRLGFERLNDGSIRSTRGQSYIPRFPSYISQLGLVFIPHSMYRVPRCSKCSMSITININNHFSPVQICQNTSNSRWLTTKHKLSDAESLLYILNSEKLFL